MANPETRHETADAPASIPAYGILLTVIFVTLSAFGVWALLNLAWRAPPPRAAPFATQARPLDSAPRLQENPTADLGELNRRMQRRLHGVGWINRSAGIVHMPIDRAMDLLIERGAADAAPAEPRAHERPARSTQQAEH